MGLVMILFLHILEKEREGGSEFGYGGDGRGFGAGLGLGVGLGLGAFGVLRSGSDGARDRIVLVHAGHVDARRDGVCVFITARAGGATGSRQVAQCGRTATSYTLYSRPSP